MTAITTQDKDKVLMRIGPGISVGQLTKGRKEIPTLNMSPVSEIVGSVVPHSPLKGNSSTMELGGDEKKPGVPPILTSAQQAEIHRRIECLPEDSIKEMLARASKKRVEFQGPRDELYFWFYCIAGLTHMITFEEESP